MVDHSAMLLGKLPPRIDHRTLRLARYLRALPPPPPTADWTGKLTNPGMMLNDRLGDCTCAAIGHLIQIWTSESGSELTLSDQDVLALYEKACGYNPTDPSTDQGGIELDVLNYWKKNPVGGATLDAYCAVSPTATGSVRSAIWLFGGAYIGLALPISAQTQDVWDLDPTNSLSTDPGSWGGHAVVVNAYDTKTLTCVTWGTLKKMTWDFFKVYCDEAYACLSKDWLESNPDSPSGFDWVTLEADLASITA